MLSALRGLCEPDEVFCDRTLSIACSQNNLSLPRTAYGVLMSDFNTLSLPPDVLMQAARPQIALKAPHREDWDSGSSFTPLGFPLNINAQSRTARNSLSETTESNGSL